MNSCKIFTNKTNCKKINFYDLVTCQIHGSTSKVNVIFNLKSNIVHSNNNQQITNEINSSFKLQQSTIHFNSLEESKLAEPYINKYGLPLSHVCCNGLGYVFTDSTNNATYNVFHGEQNYIP